MSVPWKRTTPAEGTSRRLPSRSSVDFPAPDGPASTVTRPGQTVDVDAPQELGPVVGGDVHRLEAEHRLGRGQRGGGHGVSMTPARPAS